MAPVTAFLDANVLYPSELRNLLLHFAVAGLFRARWSDAVHEEWIASLLERRPDLMREKLERTRRLMDSAVFDALVTGYEGLIPALELPDPDDRHVLAASIHGGAQIIVTHNLRDFPAGILSKFEIEACHPDEFIGRVILASPRIAWKAAETLRKSLRKPSKSVEQFLASLEDAGLRRSAALLRGQSR